MSFAPVLLHQHGAFGELLEHLLEALPFPDPVLDFLVHFILDSLELFTILIAVMFGVTLLQTYIPFDRLQTKLSALRSFGGYLLSIGLGVVSPFCSCTVIPVVMGMISVGVPVSVALCYLTSAALLNGSALVTLFSSFGFSFGAVYTLLSLILAVGTSLLLRPFLHGDSVISYHLDHTHHHHHDHCCCDHHETSSCDKKGWRIRFSLYSALDILRETWVFLLISVAISSAVLIFVPIDMLQQLLGQQNIFSPLLAGMVGAPIHADIFTILPLLNVLLPINASAMLAFALATMAISIPEILLLTRVFRGKVIAVYTAFLTLFSVAAGYVSLLFPFFS